MTKQQHTPTPCCVAGKYLVAKSPRYGQSTGEALIAEFKKHRLGSADRVAPDEVQEEWKAFIVRAVNNHQALIEALEQILAYSDSSTDPAIPNCARSALRQAK